MRVLVVDDEQPARDRLRQILDDEDDYEVVGAASNGHDAIELCNELQPDVVLLDIRMPGLGGIETAHHLNSLSSPPAIVFATAYDEYAIDAFEALAVGYVLKPVRRSRLTAALRQASRIAAATLSEVGTQTQSATTRQHVCTHSHGELKLIPIEDIVVFRADQKYVTVVHDHGQDLIDESLKALEDEFSSDFVRVHRSALVAVTRIGQIEKADDGKSRLVLREHSQLDDNELIISRRHVAEVRRRLKGH